MYQNPNLYPIIKHPTLVRNVDSNIETGDLVDIMWSNQGGALYRVDDIRYVEHGTKSTLCQYKLTRITHPRYPAYATDMRDDWDWLHHSHCRLNTKKLCINQLITQYSIA